MKRFICFSIAPERVVLRQFWLYLFKEENGVLTGNFPIKTSSVFQTALHPNQLLITSTLVSKVTVCWYLDAVLRCG